MECSLGFSEFLSGTPLHVAEVTCIWIGRARSICLEQPWQNYAIFMVIFFYFLGKSIPCVDGSFHIFCFFFGTYLHVVEAGCNWTFYANVSGLQQTLQKGVFLIIIPIFCFEQDTLFQEQSLDIFLGLFACVCILHWPDANGLRMLMASVKITLPKCGAGREYHTPALQIKADARRFSPWIARL
jgi:hypothetical protein